jgi:hypothetical protein
MDNRFFSSPQSPNWLWDPPQPIKWVPGVLSQEAKQLGSETDHSLPSSAEVKDMWIYALTPPYILMA